MPESITPKPKEKKTIKNEYDFRRELLSALEEDSSSNNEVKDTEIYRQHILHALGQEFDQDDIKQTNNFRAKVVDGVKELLNGGGGDPETVNIKIKNNSSHPVIVSTMINYNGLTASRRVSNNSTETLRVVMFTDRMPFSFTTTDGGSISSTSVFGTVTFNNAYSGYITQGDTITIASV